MASAAAAQSMVSSWCCQLLGSGRLAGRAVDLSQQQASLKLALFLGSLLTQPQGWTTC